MRRLGFACSVAIAAVGLATQQDAKKPPEIHGVVMEADVNLPVAGAEVTLYNQAPGPVKINGGWQPDSTRKTKTDDSGSFTLTLDAPGDYRVESRKEGYEADEMSGWNLG